MLEIGYHSSLYVQFRLLSKTIWTENYAVETYQSNLSSKMIMWSDYLTTFPYSIVILDALITPNYSLKELFIKSCKMQTGLPSYRLWCLW